MIDPINTFNYSFLNHLISCTADREMSAELKAIIDKVQKAVGEIDKNVTAETPKFAKTKARSIDELTASEYNNHGWVKANDLVSNRKLADFMNKIGDKERAKADWYGKVGNDRHIIAVHDADGVNNTLIVTNGKFNNPSIERVYDIGLDNETDIELLGSEIYAREEFGKGDTASEVINDYFKDEPIRCHTKEDFPTYREFREERERAKSEGNQRETGELQDERRSRKDSKQPITKYSKEVKPPKGGSFDAEAKNLDGLFI